MQRLQTTVGRIHPHAMQIYRISDAEDYASIPALLSAILESLLRIVQARLKEAKFCKKCAMEGYRHFDYLKIRQ